MNHKGPNEENGNLNLIRNLTQINRHMLNVSQPLLPRLRSNSSGAVDSYAPEQRRQQLISILEQSLKIMEEEDNEYETDTIVDDGQAFLGALDWRSQRAGPARCILGDFKI